MVRNSHLDLMDQDILYHLALGSGSHDLRAMFGDVKVCSYILCNKIYIFQVCNKFYLNEATAYGYIMFIYLYIVYYILHLYFKYYVKKSIKELQF